MVILITDSIKSSSQ